MSPNALIDKFIDIVSKNGNLLLNVPIKADGTLDEETIHILEEMGDWLSVNGEGIYGSRPWYIFGEGPTGEMDHRALESPFTSRDIRYTIKNGDLYAFVLDWPRSDSQVILTFLAPGNARIGEITDVNMLGYEGELEWQRHPDGLIVHMPWDKPWIDAARYAVGLRMKVEGIPVE
jgi:alpha-L-fucosidase